MEQLVIDPNSPLHVGEDQLQFTGEFIPVAAAVAYGQLMAGTATLTTRSSARSSGVWFGGETQFPVNLRTTDNSDPGLTIGRTYLIEGAITGSNFFRVPNLTFVPGGETTLNPTPGVNRRIQVTGLGTIKKIRQFQINGLAANPLIELIVEHKQARSPGKPIRVRCLLGWQYCQVPPNIQFFRDSRIFYSGLLDGYDLNSGRNIIEASFIPYEPNDFW
ncbi:hypothetical protein PSTG_02479 [Puccinia striiformis f. sp. tritici PST-78]|uniref:Uncharacterized protein n=1 Tax=Puccinia striiformis f. sp. tritici PST-78 TaxID=1165861 RepID=A0A0L0VZ48_9BASI|nr:hypothetical protein PSTG_02479 [Puccinia striiformis f. sp. tritici PST-78]